MAPAPDGPIRARRAQQIQCSRVIAAHRAVIRLRDGALLMGATRRLTHVCG